MASVFLENGLPRAFMSINALTRNNIESLFLEVKDIAIQPKNKLSEILRDKILSVLFFQPSTRTRLSFEIAMLRLGGKVSGFSDIKTTRSGDFFKESFHDLIHVVAQMSDCIVARHFENLDFIDASLSSPIPIINAGNGDGEHPTQALADLSLLNKVLGGVDGINIGLVGDPECRVVKSMIFGLSKFSLNSLLFLLPPGKKIPAEVIAQLIVSGIYYYEVFNIEEMLSAVEAVSMVPFYLPNFNSIDRFDREKNPVVDSRFRVTKSKLKNVGRDVKILHCGPRGNEIDLDVDQLPNALYYRQVEEGMLLRMALLKMLLT